MFSYNNKRNDYGHSVRMFATFNTEEFQVPRGVIYVINQSVYNDYEESYALANTVSTLIEDNHGKALIIIDTANAIDSNQRAYSYIALTSNDKLFTKWQDWLNNAAVAQVLLNMHQLEIDSADYSTLQDFIHVFDDATRLPQNKPIENLIPTVSVAYDYLIHLCKHMPDEHNRFRDIVDTDLKAAVLSEINKIKNKTKTDELNVDIQDLTNEKRNEIMESAAQYLVMGILARILKRPVRCFARVVNLTTRYIENMLLGMNDRNDHAIQTIPLTFVNLFRTVKMKIEGNEYQYCSAFTDFFKKNPTYYAETTKNRYRNSQVVVAEARFVSLNFILQKVVIHLSAEQTSLNLLDMVSKEVNDVINYLKQTNTGGRNPQSAPKEKYWVSGESPDVAELFLHLRAYLASGFASLNKLELFANELHKIYALRTGSNELATVKLTTKLKFASSYLATFDTSLYNIPDGAILADGICVKKTNDGIEIDECNTGEYLSAMLNTANRLIVDNKCVAFFVLVSDTLAATNAGDEDLAAYRVVGQTFLDHHRRYYAALSLNESDIHTMTWDDWRNMPEFAESYAAICRQYEANEFKAIADVIINDFVNAEVAKLRHQGESIDMTAIMQRKRDYLLEEATQYYMLGLQAKNMNRPIRFLHKGTNALFSYIEKTLIGALANGELAIQLVDIKFIQTRNITAFFAKNCSYYHPSKPTFTVGKELKPVASEEARVSLLLNMMVHLMADSAPTNLIVMVLALIKYNLAVRKHGSYFQRFHYSNENSLFTTSSENPDQAEVFFHLMEYLESPSMTKQALKSLKCTIKSDLHSLCRK